MIDPIIATGIAAIINGAIKIWATHNGKPEGWKPTPQDIADILLDVDASTPEAMKAAARQRLGIAP